MCSYFDVSSSKSTPTDVCSTDTESDSDTDHLQPKKLCLLLYSIVLNLTHRQSSGITIKMGEGIHLVRVQ